MSRLAAPFWRQFIRADGWRRCARRQASVGHRALIAISIPRSGRFSSESHPGRQGRPPLGVKRANSGGQPGRRGNSRPLRRGDQAMLDHPLIEFLGEIDEGRKNTFLRGARGLLFSIDRVEPFGLAMIGRCRWELRSSPGATARCRKSSRRGAAASSWIRWTGRSKPSAGPP
jgi:hypothetical protein